MNLGELKNLCLKLVNSYSADGTTLPAADNADFNLAIVDFLNVAYFKAIEYAKIDAVFSVTQNPIPNLLNKYQAFNLAQHLDIDLTYESTGVQAYYFEIDGQGTVYIEEKISGVWTEIEEITVPGTVSSFTAYRGLVSASDPANSVRMRFSGTYPYSIRNRALYEYTFPDADSVPQFKPYMRYALPADYISLNKIVRNSDNRLHETMTDYFIEGNYLVVNYLYTGSLDVHYYKRPDELVDDEDVPELKPEFHRYIAYHAAGDWQFANGRQTDGLVLLNRFDAFMNELSPTMNEASTGIVNTTGW